MKDYPSDGVVFFWFLTYRVVAHGGNAVGSIRLIKEEQDGGGTGTENAT
jgi:hypothetical protein